MTLTELVDEVISLTNRPDLSTFITSQVKAATIKAHHSDFFVKDIKEAAVQFSPVGNIVNFNPSSIFSTYRNIKYLRISDSSGNPGPFFTKINIEQAIDGYGYTKTNVFYEAGSLIQINSYQELEYALFGAFCDPDVTDDGYSSWIASVQPYAIIYEAAAKTFKRIGYDTQATDMNNSRAEEYQELKITQTVSDYQ